MNQLIAVNKMTSMEIAEVTGKQHAHIMRDIRDEIEKLEDGGVPNESKFGLVEYTDAKGEKRPCYQLSREGVLQLAARYDAVVRAKLIELAMRSEQPKPICMEDAIIQSMQIMKEMRLQIDEAQSMANDVKTDLQSIRDVITLDPSSWRSDTSKIINNIARNLGSIEHIRTVRTEAYQLLDKRFGVSLETRLTNKRRKMAEEGVCKSKRDKTNQIDVISDDKKLIE